MDLEEINKTLHNVLKDNEELKQTVGQNGQHLAELRAVNAEQHRRIEHLEALIEIHLIQYNDDYDNIEVIDLTTQYMSGQTLVNIKVEQIKYNKIPSVTVCYPRLLSMKRLAKTYAHTYGQQYKSYLNKMRIIARGFIKENHRLRDLFDLSIPYHYGEKKSSVFNKEKVTEFAIDIRVKGIRLFHKNMTLNVIEITDTDPIESIVLPDGRQGFKCFTFFSQMKPKWREYQIELRVMHINIYQHESWFPPSLYDGSAHIYLSIHSPNIIPQQMNSNNFMRLKPGKWYEMTYNRWKTILLPPGYDTKCHEYDITSTQPGDYQLRADCVNQCLYNRLVNTCDNDKQSPLQTLHQHNATRLCLYRSDSLWRRDLVAPGAPLANDRICGEFDPGIVKAALTNNIYERLVDRMVCYRRHSSRLNNECELKCPQECTNRYYNYNVKASDTIESDSPWTKQTHIRLAHNQMPHQITEHIPEISFVQFIGTFGGLLGMWVGLSALAVLDFAFDYIKL
ncbi:unnamed protein product [Medioppia subpectinata]|uniref:Uncharacterized protein n=1 Tax=Medioppia subpectinata TaxID=1979941 RepID=A0A7R9KW17_9ACAR|nr:unnamed protein product [Medioppia subpectinata]CAG2110537.1 unnamed protein product [Medioppia subpectinata]